MKLLAILIGGVSIVLIAGIVYVQYPNFINKQTLQQNKTTEENVPQQEKKETTPETTANKIPATSKVEEKTPPQIIATNKELHEKILKGTDLVCTIANVFKTTSGVDNKTTVYISKGNYAISSTITYKGKQKTTNNVITQSVGYTWESGKNIGIKLEYNALEADKYTALNNSIKNFADMQKPSSKPNMDCIRLPIDPSHFIPPSNIQFLDGNNPESMRLYLQNTSL
jgi:hypothetical protein